MSHHVPLQCLGHLTKVGSGHLFHVILVEGARKFFYLGHSRLCQLFFALRHFQNLMSCLSIFTFEKRPHLFYWIELAALGWEELRNEVIALKELIQLLRVMNSEVIHNNYCL